MVQVIPYQRSAQIRIGKAWAETADEMASRQSNLNRKYGEESVYVKEWRRRYDRDS